MRELPDCEFPGDPAPGLTPIANQVFNFPLADMDSLPAFGGRLRWITGELGADTGNSPDYLFVIWHEGLTEKLATHLATPAYTIPLILHTADQVPPSTLSGRPLVHYCYTGKPLDAVLELVELLVMPTIYCPFVCVDIQDYEFEFARRGRLRCLSVNRNEDVDACLAELALNLSKIEQPAAYARRFVASLFVPIDLHSHRVFDRVHKIVRESNACGDPEPDIIIGGLGHRGIRTIVCVFAIETTDMPP